MQPPSAWGIPSTQKGPTGESQTECGAPTALALLAAGGCCSETETTTRRIETAEFADSHGTVQKAASSLQASSKDEGSELKTKLTAAYDDFVVRRLQEIKDSETAQAAVAKLRKSDKSLGELVQMAEKLPAAAKPVVAAFANKGPKSKSADQRIRAERRRRRYAQAGTRRRCAKLQRFASS